MWYFISFLAGIAFTLIALVIWACCCVSGKRVKPSECTIPDINQCSEEMRCDRCKYWSTGGRG